MDGPVSRRLLGPVERRINPVGDEVEGRAALHLAALARMVGQHEDRHVKRRILAPPTAGVGVVGPRALAAAVHAPAHDDGAVRGDVLGHEVGVRAALAAFSAVRSAPRRQPEHPFVKLLAALPQRVLH